MSFLESEFYSMVKHRNWLKLQPIQPTILSFSLEFCLHVRVCTWWCNTTYLRNGVFESGRRISSNCLCLLTTLLKAVHNMCFWYWFVYFFVCECFACLFACCTLCMPVAWRSQKRVLDHLDLELQMIVNQYSGTRNQIWVLCKSNKYCWAMSIAQVYLF